MCEFVRLVKGVNYIQEVQERTRAAESSDNPVVHMTMEDAMKTEPVKLALEIGIDDNILRNKIQQQILETGRTYETIDDLLKAVFDEQENLNPGIDNSSQTCSESNCLSSNQSNHNAALNTNNESHCSDTRIEYVLSRACDSTLTASSIQKINEENSPEILSSKLLSNQMEITSQCLDIKEKITPDRKSLEEENRKLKDARLCKVCLDEEVGVVYLPCGHLGIV